MNVSTVITKNYEQLTMDNELKTNPIQTQYEANTNPKQTQNKPNSNPIQTQFQGQNNAKCYHKHQ